GRAWRCVMVRVRGGPAPSSEAEPHLVQRDPAEQAGRRRQRRDDLEMVETGALEHFDRHALLLEHGGELARLPLEFVALALADADRHWAAQIGNMAERAQRLDERIVELHVIVAGAEPDRLHNLDPAAAH